MTAGSVLLLAAAAVLLDVVALAHRVPTTEVTDTRHGAGTAYLLLGSDSRERLTGEDADRYADADQASGERADVVMLLLHPADEPAKVLLVPRDLYVRPAVGPAYRLGISLDEGPQALVDHLCDDLGIGVDHLLVVDFRGLIDVVDTVGGVSLDPDRPTRDREAGVLLTRAGEQVVDGRTALAWVRSRDAEVQVDGTWRAVPFDPQVRTAHSREVLTQVVEAVDDPLTAQRVAWAGGPSVRRDARLGPVDALRLARDLRRALGADRVSTVPVRLSETEVPVGFPTEGTEAALQPFRSPGCGDG